MVGKLTVWKSECLSFGGDGNHSRSGVDVVAERLVAGGLQYSQGWSRLHCPRESALLRVRLQRVVRLCLLGAVGTPGKCLVAFPLA